MKAMTLLLAMNDIDDQYIEEAMPAEFTDKTEDGGENAGRGQTGKIRQITDVHSADKAEIPADSRRTSGAKKWRWSRRYLFVAAAAACIVLVGTVTRGRDLIEPDDVTVVSPMQECASMSEAEELAGFSMTAPDAYQNSASREIYVIDGKIIEVSYLDWDGNCIVYIRKGSGEENLSGDYNEYSYTITISRGGCDIAVKGEEDLLYTAEWTAGGYDYAVSFTDGTDSAGILGMFDLMMK